MLLKPVLATASLVLALTAAANADPTESDQANAFFEQAFDERVARSPRFQGYLGRKDDYDKWNDLSDEYARGTRDLIERQLEDLRTSIDYERLDDDTTLSYRLFEYEAERQIADFRWRYHNYPVNQMSGLHSSTVAFLINIHRIGSVADAEAYIARLESLDAYFAQLVEGLELRAEMGVVPPKFVFPSVLRDARNVITGRPFDESASDSTLLADFRAKVQALETSAAKRRALLLRAERALRQHVQPAYESLIAYVSALEARATTDDGAWKLPDGDAYYRARLARMTTTDLTPRQVHDLGLAEVARIHDEMRVIMADVGFEGSLQEFFVYLRDDPRFYYEDTEAGRSAYLSRAGEIIDTMREQLDELFRIKPRADLEVRRVEPFRERSAGKAFYQRPAPDGSRPGVYYANLYRMTDMPIYQMEALAYHEGIPGHHMQLAIAQELEGVPTFRKWARYTAYTEGWGLYSELLPKEYGFYDDPYADFGRLAMELWRACRLVVDTGIHALRWTREEAIGYLDENTPNPHGDVVKAIDRYIVSPGQATAYKVGQLKLLALRATAREELGDGFDIRQFHEVVLKNGPVPLDVLGELVHSYIAAARGAGPDASVGPPAAP